MSNYFQRNKKFILHFAFWTVYASLFFYTISFGRKGDPDWERIVADLTFHVGGMMVISYLNYFLFLPRLLKDQNVGRYLLTFVPVFLGLAFLWLRGKQAILQHFYPDDRWMYSVRFGINVITSAFFAASCVGLLKFVEDYFELEARRKELENQQLTSELQFLRAQVNPHFLFNTLNNLYYLAVNQSTRTPEVIAKLSGMMRYMIYESNHARVPLDKEIEYIENYLSLERLRLEDDVPITFEVNGNTTGVRIAPLILITFLENAFKHGVSSSAEAPWITVRLDVTKDQCEYRVANGKIAEGSKTLHDKSGIGLQNVRRRLALTYPDRHYLRITDNDDRYEVVLKLDLK
ncbi:sensor histidine kinase [Neolewinella litorea]|uniref:Sensor histidine kinase n=1 Tax=Neolewinella litorea TaxID=2562452 RepID=A0A4S4NKM0_9BACT|nr:histidine kinase [Neolewinella litorea]THH40322.1 sensor histidine kinase [Neolewinella litorea]